MLLTEQKFSAIPGHNNPSLLLNNYQQKLLDSLKHHFNKFGETVHMDFSYFIEKINCIDCKRRFSPFLHSIYGRIKEFYEKKNLEGLFHTAQIFKNRNIENLYADEIHYNSFLSEDWEEAIVSELKNSIPGKIEERTVFPLIHWNEKDFPPSDFQTALNHLQNLDETLYQEFVVYISRVKFFSSKLLIACSSPKFFGTIYMRPPGVNEDAIVYYLDGLAHEVSHQHLYAIMAQEAIVLNAPDELFSSPLRPDPRPMNGIFHSAFVLARIIRILRLYQKIKGNVLEILNKKEMRFKEACTIIAEKAKLSHFGQELYHSLEHCAFQNS